MTQYYFDLQGRFVIEQYDRAPAFASFLPGLAGPLGIPLWAFYVNRGQAMAAFGVGSKDAAIVEFQPANKAYQSVPLTGFRTLIKLAGPPPRIYEPFSAFRSCDPVRPPTRRLLIGMSEVEVEEVDEEAGLQLNALYFTLPGEPFAGLVRQLTVKNLVSEPVELEILDGLPAVVPFGINNDQLKQIGRTVEAWMAVYNLESGIPFYRVQATIGDEAEVSKVEAGHFCLPFGEILDASGRSRATLQRPAVIVDPAVIFGNNTALTFPDRFATRSLAELGATRQVTVSRTPCALAGAAATLAPGESLSVCAIVGHVADIAVVEAARDRLARPAYLAAKRSEARALALSLTDPVATETSDPRFDAYCRQTLLDNTLRGGWPTRIGGKIVHLYGRRHGDLERDYNAFRLPPEFYSQGNAAYRDLNQNWRSDVLLDPAVGDSEILALLGLLQPDGYNPLVVLGSRFRVPAARQPAILALVDRPHALRPLLSAAFTPGGLLKAVFDGGLALSVAPQAFVESALAVAEQDFAADHGEGYWMDHWYYNLDLIQSYLAVYPDHKDQLLFERQVTYYDTPWFVRPRDLKIVLTAEGARQYDAVGFDEEHAALIAARPEWPNLARSGHGRGEIFRTTVLTKLLGLALVKFATLDPAGMGMEMEAGKPGWCDALNGLPGLFGSAMPATYELRRLFDFLLDALAGKETSVALPLEFVQLARDLRAALAAHAASTSHDRDFRFWHEAATAREEYRAATRLGFDGGMERVACADLRPSLRAFRDKVADGIRRAESLAPVPPAYFTYDVVASELVRDTGGHPVVDTRGRPFGQPARFEQRLLPDFLEGPVHALRAERDVNRARDLYRRVRESELYDAKLGMVKTNGPLDACSHEIGRLRAFTPGWLENESIFLHMAYKYLLEVLRAGLTEEFFAEMRAGLVPFVDPAVYGRSPLENSSFIVSSAHPDESIHGRGFVARLTGACAEFLSMWTCMMAGPQPFTLRDGELCLSFRPALPRWLFRDDGTLSFTFLGRCPVTYRLSDGAAEVSRVSRAILYRAGEAVEIAGEVIPAPYAGMVRDGAIERIELELA